MILSEEDFTKCINDIEKVIRYSDGLNNYFNKHDVDGYLFQPDCTETIIFLLHKIFGKSDFDEWISYYAFELDFGKKYKEGTIIGKNGQDIKLATPQDLYKLLCEGEE